ncbi:MAG: flagellar hook-basal body complex protein FliE [Rhodospirillales bacterium]|nr:flagellar hook-basal body complex protein FliE [Rhodospirillales bacterium]MCB9965280.1 flagellar hook-basal body complex protein FliE [Rhodospirillales bacterium]MCB9972951.1 flagellar hook-basal body complex protein FliE [Rhodospirillales bacterium]MCB9980111.1 flagellar hook-basal body complex protein FliE [Rhodospirillales bacterium]
MTISDSLNAANAYKTIARQVQGVAGGDSDDTGSASGTQSGGGDFMGMVKKAAQSSLETLKQGEVASAKAITGETTLPELIQAVSAAEMTLQTTMAVRDRMISAYQEIMRMPI